MDFLNISTAITPSSACSTTIPRFSKSLTVISVFIGWSSASKTLLPLKSQVFFESLFKSINSLISSAPGSETGISTVKVLPWFITLSTSMVPPIRLTKFFDIASPNPVPSWDEENLFCSCSNGLKTRLKKSLLIPTP